MRHSPAEIVRELLVALGAGSAWDQDAQLAWPIFATGEPNMPDDCITVYDTQGTSDGRSMIDGEVWEHPGVQVRVRSAEHNDGYEKAVAVKAVMASAYQRSVTIAGARYLVYCLAHIGQVLPIGKDVPRSKRSLFTINATVALRER